MECFVNFMSCLDEEREIVREDAAMGFDWDRKMKVLESAVVVVVMSKSGDGTFRQHAKFIYHTIRYRQR